MAVLNFLVSFYFIHAVIAKGSESQIQCTPEYMKVTVPMDGDRQLSYLDQMKDFKPCFPTLERNVAVFVLDLQDHSKCGITRVLNRMTGHRTFYHKVVIESVDGSRETVTVRCSLSSKQRIQRDVQKQEFPLDFNEPDVLNITVLEAGRAPEPIVGAVVKQNGKQVTGEISVSPGTPLSMEIFLNEESAPVYGLLMNYMQVTDTGKQQETIILNSCSVDPYLFDNFLTSDGDTLTAKFRAFKFPDSTYVQFIGTVTVCIDKCPGVQCSNGVTAYGRKRRAIAETSDSNKVYEVSLTTLIKVEDINGESREAENVLDLLKNLKVANQRLGNQDGTEAIVAEQTQNKLIIQPEQPKVSSANVIVLSCVLLICSIVITLLK